MGPTAAYFTIPDIPRGACGCRAPLALCDRRAGNVRNRNLNLNGDSKLGQLGEAEVRLALLLPRNSSAPIGEINYRDCCQAAAELSVIE